MASNNPRRRLSFVDFAHPQVWHKLIEYSEMTIALTKLSSSLRNLLISHDLLYSSDDIY